MRGFRRLSLTAAAKRLAIRAVEEILILLWGSLLLLPLIEVTGLEQPRLFYFLLIAAGGLDVLTPWALLSSPAKLATALTVLHQIYYATLPLWPSAWLPTFLVQLRQDLIWARGGFWSLVGSEGKTLAFLLSLLLAHCLLRSAARRWQPALTLLLTGLILLALAGTYTDLTVLPYVKGYLFLGLFLLALSSWREQERRSRWIPGSNWWVPGSLLLALAVTGFAQAAPRPHLTWHLDWLERLGKGLVAEGPQKSGYGSNDASLGGSFMQDQTVVFTVQAPVDAYWRGESKESYTGKGWDEDPSRGRPLAVGQEIAGTMWPGDAGTLVEQTFTVKADAFGVLLAANRPIKVLELPRRKRLSYLSGSQRLSTGPLSVDETYRVLSFVPQFQADDLRRTGSGYASSITKRYLQLPASLPARVRELANQVAAGKDNPYDRALALESYLRSTYRYETRDVPPPPEGEDFVDHILFSTGRGYCDHFSTTMVVMARAIGLPARWVKGFAPGEEVLGLGDSEKTFVVRSLNAHSWPEVYFEGYGWVPFEPTPGFSPIAAGTAAAENNIAQPPVEKALNEPLARTGLSLPGLGALPGRPLLFAVLLMALMAALVLAVVLISRSRKRATLTTDEGRRQVINRAYFSAIRAMGRPKRRPAETFGTFAQRRAENNFPAAGELLALTRLWETASYGSRPPGQEETAVAWKLAEVIRDCRR